MYRWDSAFLTNFQELLVVLVYRPHFEKQGPKMFPLSYRWEEGFKKKDNRVIMGIADTWTRLKEDMPYVCLFSLVYGGIILISLALLWESD